MNGDEDLGQDITMKGQKFHYAFDDFAEGDNDAKQNITITVKGQKITYAQAEGVCDGVNGQNMQDCRVSRWGDQNPRCSGAPGEEKGRNCVNTLSQAEGVCDGTNG